MMLYSFFFTIMLSHRDRHILDEYQGGGVINIISGCPFFFFKEWMSIYKLSYLGGLVSHAHRCDSFLSHCISL